MKRILIASLLGSALAGSTLAQTEPAPTAADPATPAERMGATPDTGATESGNADAAMSGMQSEGGFFTYQEGNQMLGSGLMGANVLGAEGEDIGDVDDILLDRNGQVMAVVVGVGGFLGIGEKDVAIANDQLEFVLAEEAAATGTATTAAPAAGTSPTGMSTTPPGTVAPDGTPPVAATSGNDAGSSAMNTSGNAMTGTGDTGMTTGSNYGWGWSGAGIDHIQVSFTREQLEAAPAFEYAE